MLTYAYVKVELIFINVGILLKRYMFVSLPLLFRLG